MSPTPQAAARAPPLSAAPPGFSGLRLTRPADGGSKDPSHAQTQAWPQPLLVTLLADRTPAATAADLAGEPVTCLSFGAILSSFIGNFCF